MHICFGFYCRRCAPGLARFLSTGQSSSQAQLSKRSNDDNFFFVFCIISGIAFSILLFSEGHPFRQHIPYFAPFLTFSVRYAYYSLNRIWRSFGTCLIWNSLLRCLSCLYMFSRMRVMKRIHQLMFLMILKKMRSKNQIIGYNKKKCVNPKNRPICFV